MILPTVRKSPLITMKAILGRGAVTNKTGAVTNWQPLRLLVVDFLSWSQATATSSQHWQSQWHTQNETAPLI